MRETIEGPVHFIGIGGSGMAGLAELALNQGFSVQGSDLNPSPVLARLQKLGARVAFDHNAAALTDARTVVFSSAIKRGNVELDTARAKHLNVLHRSEFLALLMADHKAITIAGTHGKSTTSAMITHMLDSLGLDPVAATGATIRRYGSAARTGKGEYFVAEADESDGSFLKYCPLIGVLTNVAPDHMEYFKDQTGLLAAFRDYLARIDPEDGVAVVGWDNPLSRQVGTEYPNSRLTYGFLLGSEVRAIEYQSLEGETTFSAIVERDRVSCRLKSMGRHNVQNALCSLAVARALSLNVKAAAEALAEFTGVDRRMALVHAAQGLHIFDDFAHNPGKIAACIETLKEAWPGAALHVVYQPHRFSRLETMYDEMLGALVGADFVHVVPVYSAGESTTLDFSTMRLAEDLKTRFKVNAVACNLLADATASVKKSLQRPAVVLTVGAGDVWKIAEQLKDALA